MQEKWSRSFRYWVLTILVVLLAVTLWAVREMIAPLVVAGLVAYVLNPIVDLLNQRARVPRSLAIVIVFLLGLGGVALLVMLMLPTLIEEVRILAGDFVNIISQAGDFLAQPVYFLQWEFNLGSLIPDPFGVISERITALPENLLHILEATTANLIWGLVIVVTTFYLLRDWKRLRDWVLDQSPQGYRADAEKLREEIKEVWHGYLRGNLALMAIVAVAFTTAWFAIGLPGALILGIVAGILTIIPDLGPAIAAALAAIVALFEGSNYLPISNFWFMVLVVGIYLVLVNIKSIWIRPRIFGQSVHMHDGLVFVAIMVAVVVQGILGALVVVPVLASAGVIGRYIYYRLQGLPPWPEETGSDAADELGSPEDEGAHTEPQSAKD